MYTIAETGHVKGMCRFGTWIWNMNMDLGLLIWE
jgi:hypothetical protein